MGNFLSQLHFYQPGALIKVTGQDAFSFLQGQFTNDLRQPAGRATYGLWLNQKGKVLADSQVLRQAENEFTLVSANATATVLLQRLEQYIIADDVTLRDDTEKSHGLVLWGEACGQLVKAWAGSLPVRGQYLEKEGVLIFAGRRLKSENYELIGPENILSELGKKLLAQGCSGAAADILETARISSGIPAIPQDIGPTDLPNEAGLEDSAICFTKGCYLGQEVMARLKNLGQVRRQLRGVRGTGGLPKSGTPLFQATKKAGEIRSAVSTGKGFIALAMLTRMGLDENAGFTFEETSQPGQNVTVWMS